MKENNTCVNATIDYISNLTNKNFIFYNFGVDFISTKNKFFTLINETMKVCSCFISDPIYNYLIDLESGLYFNELYKYNNTLECIIPNKTEEIT